MQIRKKFFAISLSLLVIVLMLGASHYWELLQFNQAIKKNNDTAFITDGVFEKKILLDEYFLYHNERPRIQFEQKQLALLEFVQQLQKAYPLNEDQRALQRIIDDLRTSRRTFLDLIATEADSTMEESVKIEKIRILSAALLSQSQEIIAQTNQLHKTTLAQIVDTQQVIVLQTIFFISVLVFIVLIGNYVLYRSIVNPITVLHELTEKVGAGNLDLRVGTTAHDEIGQLSRAFDDMTEKLQKSYEQLEERVRQRTAELQASEQHLEAANKELEAFSYSVSHDLRAPLRAIDGFSKILVDDYGSKLNQDAQHVVATIRENAQNMGNLIDDLLAFSRLGRQAMTLQYCNMEVLARQVCEELRALEPGREIVCIIHPLEHATVDTTLMTQVWANLLSNAMKFTSHTKRATIEVESRTQGDQVVYSVKDNGAGFDMTYKDKLFNVFQRLHTTDQFPGTGIGLALVKRIITRHGGNVWAEGTVGKGATFYFSLPRKNAIKT